MILSDPKALKILAPQTLAAPLAAIALLKAALTVFITPQRRQTTLNHFVMESFFADKKKARVSILSPVRLALLIVILSAFRAIFTITSGRWFYKNIVQRFIGRGGKGVSYFLSNIVGATSAGSVVASSLSCSSIVSKSIGVFLITLSGILFQLAIAKTKQELYTHIECTTKTAILNKMGTSTKENCFSNPYHGKESSVLAASTLNDTVSRYGKACIVALESCGYLTGSILACSSSVLYSSSSSSSSSRFAFLPNLRDWNQIEAFMKNTINPKKGGLELLRAFGLSQFASPSPTSFPAFIKSLLSIREEEIANNNSHAKKRNSTSNNIISKQSSSRSSELLRALFKGTFKHSLLLPPNANTVSSVSWNGCKLKKWQALVSEAFRQSQVLSSELCVTDEEREAYLKLMLKQSGMNVVPTATTTSGSESRTRMRRRRSSSTSSSSSSSSASSFSLLSLLNVSDVIKNTEFYDFIRSSVIRSIVASSTVVGIDSVLLENDPHPLLQGSLILQSAASIFASAAELAKVTDKLYPVLSHQTTHKKRGFFSQKYETTSYVEENNNVVNDNNNNNTSVVVEENTHIGYVSLHRNSSASFSSSTTSASSAYHDLRLTGKVTVVESNLYTGRDAGSRNNTPVSSAPSSLNNSFSDVNNISSSGDSNNTTATDPVPTLTSTTALPFHLYPGAGLLVATETSKIGETFISSLITSIQSAFPSQQQHQSPSPSSSLFEIITADPLVVPELTLADQITFPQKARDVGNEMALSNLLDDVDLGHLIEDDFGVFSSLPVCSGAAEQALRKNCPIQLTTLCQRQQLAAARVLFRKPRYVILWNSLFQQQQDGSLSSVQAREEQVTTTSQHHQQQQSSSTPLFKTIVEKFKKAGITVVSVFTCSQILDWKIRSTVMSCHFNGLFLRDDQDFHSAILTKKKQQQQQNELGGENNNNNNDDASTNNCQLSRNSSFSSVDSSMTVPLGYNGDSSGSHHVSSAFGMLLNPPSLIEPVNLENEVRSFAPETFLQFSKTIAKSSVRV